MTAEAKPTAAALPADGIQDRSPSNELDRGLEFDASALLNRRSAALGLLGGVGILGQPAYGSITESVSTGTTSNSFGLIETAAVIPDSITAIVEGLDVDVHWHGAIGDGIADDCPAFAAASVAAGPGGTIRCRPGKTYLWASRPVLRRDQTLDGQGSTIRHAKVIGSEPKVLPFNLFSTNTMSGSGEYSWVIKNVTLDGNSPNVPEPGADDAANGAPYNPLVQHMGIYVVGLGTAGWAGTVTIDNVRFRNFHGNNIRYLGAAAQNNGIGANAANSPWARCIIRNVDIDGGYNGIHGDRGRGLVIEGGIIRNTEANGILRTLTRGDKVTGVTIDRPGMDGIVGTYTLDEQIIGCHVTEAGESGFVGGGGNGGVVIFQGATWVGNTATDCEWHGFVIDPILSAPAGDGQTHAVASTISACQARNNKYHGIYINGCSQVSVVGCSATGAPTGYSGLAILGYRVTVDGGTYTGNATGVALQGDKAPTNGMTGYGFHKIDVAVYGNVKDWQFGSGINSGAVGTVLTFVTKASPQGAIFAPRGSTSTDALTGNIYRKTTDASSNTGWVTP